MGTEAIKFMLKFHHFIIEEGGDSKLYEFRILQIEPSINL